MKYLLLLIALLTFCSNDSNIAGGTSTETTNGMIIVSNMGTPVANAEVLIIDNSNWYQQILNGDLLIIDTIFSNSEGFIFIEDSASTATFQIIHKDGSAIVSGLTDTIILTETYSLSGSANGYKKLYLGGTSLSAESQDNDSFYIENVPAGIYSLFTKSENSLSLTSRIELDHNKNTQTINSDTSLLFDDFIGGFDGNPLAPVTSGLYWYTFSDYKNYHYTNKSWIEQKNPGSGNSIVTPKVIDDKVHFTVFLDSSSEGSYAGVGARLFGSSTNVGYDLSEMSGFRVKLSGSGTVALFFKSSLIDSINEESAMNISHYHVKIDLKGTPIDTTFYINNLHMESEDVNYESLYPWNKCSNNIKVLQVNYRTKENAGNTNYWFELDEIRFNNVNLPL